MPKAGFNSITVADSVHDHFKNIYDKRKEELRLKGITSFSGFITSKLNQIMEKEK